MPGDTGDGSGRGDAWSQPCLAASDTDAGLWSLRRAGWRVSALQIGQRAMTGRKWPVMAIQIECVPASTAMRKAGHGAGSLKARTDFQADGQRPSKWNQTEVWPKALRGAEFRAQLSWDSRFLE